MNNVSSLPLLLKQLKLMTMLKLWEDHEQEAKNNNLSHAKYLQLLVELEVNSRYSSKVKRYMRESKLPSGKFFICPLRKIGKPVLPDFLIFKKVF